MNKRTLLNFIAGAAKGAQGPWPPQIFSIYSHFVLREAVYQTKECYSPKIKHFAHPSFVAAPRFLGWNATIELVCD